MSVPDGTYTVGDGLILKVRNGGKSRSWIYRYSIGGKRKDYAIAPAKKMTLPAAKLEAARLQGLVVSGVDVQLEKQKKKREAPEQLPSLHPFNRFALEAYENYRQMRGRLAPSTLRRHEVLLQNHILPAFGRRPIEEITTDDILDALRPIWAEKTVTADYVRILLEAIFSYAVNRKIIATNPAVWHGNLQFFLPPPYVIRKPEHYKAMDRYELREKLRTRYPSKSRIIALIVFTVLTASRINESRLARWDEFDFEERVWTCPRLKDKRRTDPHRVPLSDQAVELLRSLFRGDSPYVFTLDATDESRPPVGQDYTLNVFRREFETDATLHGFRSTFRDWCAEEGKSFEAAEIQMQHKIGTAVTRSYFRSDLLEQRRELMQEWADFLLPRNQQKEDGTQI